MSLSHRFSQARSSRSSLPLASSAPCAPARAPEHTHPPVHAALHPPATVPAQTNAPDHLRNTRIMSSTASAVREISIAHSPDSDDAFMFYGLATNKVRVPGYKFTHTLTDIETLNQPAIKEAFYD